MAFTASVITAVQNRVNTQGIGGTTMGLNQLLTYLQAVDVPALTTDTSGNIQTGGAGLTNAQYQQLYEMLF
jgi:hypothetical protein